MQFIKTLCTTLITFAPALLPAQTTYFQPGSKEALFLERLEIKAGRDSVLNFSKTLPYSRKMFIPGVEGMDSLLVSAADRYNHFSTIAGGLEWASAAPDRYRSRKPVLKHFYKTPATFYEVAQPDFFLAVNPIVQYVVAGESGNEEHLFLNTRGLTLRGRIAEKIGFGAYFTENQERNAQYVQRWERERDALPGQGYYKNFRGTGYDYFDARGYFSVNATRYIDVVFGYDRNFIGNGQRSLFLSDFGSNMLFLKLNTRIWKFNYQNLFMELQATEPRGADRLLGKKYAAMHHLDMAVTQWLNIGLFEAVVFGRKDRFDFSYLNPVIFLRSIEQQNGSADNAVVGLDFKANAARRFQAYGQLLLDEFKLDEITGGRGWWANKWAWQLGARYVDAFSVPNLDLQAEANRVRPFTYSHNDSLANYTHYNQPLAHPLGANFQEWIGIVRYQPFPKLRLEAKIIYYNQGRDVDTVSYGSNIFLPAVPPYRKEDYGYEVGSGLRTAVQLTSLLASYEVKQNLFIDAYLLHRSEAPEGGLKNSSTILSAGVRWNMQRRVFEF